MKNSILKITSAAVLVASVCGFSGAFASDNESEAGSVSAKYFVYDKEGDKFDDLPGSDKRFVGKAGHLAETIGAQAAEKCKKYGIKLAEHQAQLGKLEPQFDSNNYKELKKRVRASKNPTLTDSRALEDANSLKEAIMLKRAELDFLMEKQRENAEVRFLVSEIPGLLQKCLRWEMGKPNTISTSVSTAYVDGKPREHTVLDDVHGQTSNAGEKNVVALFSNFNRIFSSYFGELEEAKQEVRDNGEGSLWGRKFLSRNTQSGKFAKQLYGALDKKLTFGLKTNKYYPEESGLEILLRPFVVHNIREYGSDIKLLTPRVELYNTLVEAVEAFQAEREAHVEKLDQGHGNLVSTNVSQEDDGYVEDSLAEASDSDTSDDELVVNLFG